MFWDFLKRCRNAEIDVPIIPGYAPIQNQASFQKFVRWVRPTIPTIIEENMNSANGNDEQVFEYGVELGAEQCGVLIKGDAPGIHFFTLNLAASVASILVKLGLRKEDLAFASSRDLPFRGVIRASEEIRPIFWSNRCNSYLSRTSTWKEFPNGRWGDSRSAATFELSDYYLAEAKRSRIDLLKMWGIPQNTKDVGNIFIRYLRGEIDLLPWCEHDLAVETESISEALCWIIHHGFFTINSQPKVNGIPSDDECYGWGGSGGYCFQKAYVEFFCSPESWFRLKKVIDEQVRRYKQTLKFL